MSLWLSRMSEWVEWVGIICDFTENEWENTAESKAMQSLLLSVAESNTLCRRITEPIHPISLDHLIHKPHYA